ncbi:hypothetical protein [Flavobacterium frigidarium]|uniref:hypothetical protein n=1 Tax=Flavobacterium frigidarium TaxID=99286 RepID=UPI0003FDCB4B|nr:hypothetical protein [Flavobacterium frigidarium]
MAKKSFSGGLSSLLGDTNKPEAVPATVEPKENSKKTVQAPQADAKGVETRATFIVQEELLEKMRTIAYWDRMLIKDIVNDAFESYIMRHEKNNGEIKAMPKK